MPNKVYIGQTRLSSVMKRYDGHKRSATNWLKEKFMVGKNTKLYQTMVAWGPDTMIVKTLESHECQNKNDLINILNERENYYIDKYNSIENGWNKIKAPIKKRLQNLDEGTTMTDIANENNVDYRKLTYRINKGMKIEDAINDIKTSEKKPSIIYNYGRQKFDFISNLANSRMHNPNNVTKKTIEKRIKNLKDQNKLKSEFNEHTNERTLYLVDSIFKKVNDKSISVETPTGVLSGKDINDLHQKLLNNKKFKNFIPKTYATVQSRLSKGWTPEQTFGFRYPPNFIKEEELIKNQGYKWAVEKPDFLRLGTRVKPVILHVKKEIFTSQKEFCGVYKGLKEDLVSDRFKDGSSAEEVLEYYELEP